MYLRVNLTQNSFYREQLFVILKFALGQIIEELNTYTIIKFRYPVALRRSDFAFRFFRLHATSVTASVV
jgi:hypothetical protein